MSPYHLRLSVPGSEKCFSSVGAESTAGRGIMESGKHAAR